MITLELGRRSTCLLPRFSALLIVFKTSANTDIFVICRGHSNGARKRWSRRNFDEALYREGNKLAMALKVQACPYNTNEKDEAPKLTFIEYFILQKS